MSSSNGESIFFNQNLRMILRCSKCYSEDRKGECYEAYFPSKILKTMLSLFPRKSTKNVHISSIRFVVQRITPNHFTVLIERNVLFTVCLTRNLTSIMLRCE